jgi:hypothetical protein
LLVTGPGNAQDVRLDIALTGAVDKQFHTLVIVSGANGALLNASLIPQRGTATQLKNTHARVRLAAGPTPTATSRQRSRARGSAGCCAHPTSVPTSSSIRAAAR